MIRATANTGIDRTNSGASLAGMTETLIIDQPGDIHSEGLWTDVTGEPGIVRPEWITRLRALDDAELIEELSEERGVQFRGLLERCHTAIQAFRDPEGRFPEETGEYAELGIVGFAIEEALGIEIPEAWMDEVGRSRAAAFRTLGQMDVEMTPEGRALFERDALKAGYVPIALSTEIAPCRDCEAGVCENQEDLIGDGMMEELMRSREED